MKRLIAIFRWFWGYYEPWVVYDNFLRYGGEPQARMLKCRCGGPTLLSRNITEVAIGPYPSLAQAAAAAAAFRKQYRRRRN